MKTTNIVVGLLALLLLFVPGCKGKQEPPTLPETARLSLSIGGVSVEEKLIARDGDSFFLQIKSNRPWALELTPGDASEWIGIETKSGSGDASVIVRIGANSGTERMAELMARADGQTVRLALRQQGKPSDSTPEPTPEPGHEIIKGDVTLMELPRLHGGGQNYFVTHRLKDGQVNYSLEYDVQRRHSRWVAFTFDAQNSRKHTTRTDDWAWDPEIPAAYDTSTWFKGSGFDRGHLVASEDRVSSKEANQQTFYYTNMSPQRGVLNREYWQKLEALVQSWGRNAKMRDIIYVAKGGTIADGQIESRRLKGAMVIPTHYWMALVCRKGDAYQGLAFWVEHREYERGTRAQKTALSIAELQEKIGLDLFHNLPDEIEQTVEVETPVAMKWPGL